MVFCNNNKDCSEWDGLNSHNPYFNRWFSAITNVQSLTMIIMGHNPYFNRWFSAIFNSNGDILDDKSHNPYFNRWFSAIQTQRRLKI